MLRAVVIISVTAGIGAGAFHIGGLAATGLCAIAYTAGLYAGISAQHDSTGEHS